MEESFSDYIKTISYLFKKKKNTQTIQKSEKRKAGVSHVVIPPWELPVLPEMFLYSLHSSSCAIFFFLQNEHVLCQLFSPYNMHIFLCQ